ncbi:sialate:O-sulfotransferase 1 [Triplophysa dalaica]|uniref:sialate:O-sulfotransferase 1 n=1 Tax=Triplophysa dalaica TaxID=1582913 RepID=UPI0024DFECC5|nr:sialate:O-sulfotransferase 1 [Triplophysa dalaica]XP_056592672.1 sialate:O-sulfotransferase 1 [Triplophysa dalaica]
MAKAFHRLLHFLRRAQLLLLFLGVAYIMAGSVLMYQRFSFSSLQRETDSITIPSLPAPPGAQEDPAVRWFYRRNGARLMLDEENQPVDLSGSRSAQKHLRSHSLESRYKRRRWFQGNTDEQQRPPERNLLHKKNRHKGTYIGCFINNETEHALGGIVLYDFRKMTSALCQDTCSESGFRYAGLEYGAECHCGNRVCARRARGEECYLDCRGEKGPPCGGVGRMSVYRVEDRLPGQRKYRTVHYHGCFKKPKNSTDNVLVKTSGLTHTPQECIEICTEQELPLAFLRGRDCFCDHAPFVFTLQWSGQEHTCGRGNQTNRTSQHDLNYLQVYSTPVLDAKCKERNFLPQRSSTLVALSSFPGAGNTWLRHLIESATGFYTGSYYFDGSLYNKGFKGEKDHWQSGRVLCVKTHESGQREIEMFDSAILLMRNPYRSLMAEFNRKCAGHLGYASDAHWRSKEWLEFVDSYSSWWVSHAVAWLKFARRLLVVHFENLQKDLVPQFKTITAFLNISIPEERLLCTESNRDGHFKRSGSRILTFEPFTSEMRERIDKYIQTVDKALRDRNLSGIPKEYMHR